MPPVSDKKKDKISEQILHFLFEVSPQSKFTSQIAVEIARDEEFTKSILQGLGKKKLVVIVTKNKDGKDYLKRQRWRLSNEAYEIYKQHQLTNKEISTTSRASDDED
jgi:predicted transcriptional regulator with HTH domain